MLSFASKSAVPRFCGEFFSSISATSVWGKVCSIDSSSDNVGTPDWTNSHFASNSSSDDSSITSGINNCTTDATRDRACPINLSMRMKCTGVDAVGMSRDCKKTVEGHSVSVSTRLRQTGIFTLYSLSLLCCCFLHHYYFPSGEYREAESPVVFAAASVQSQHDGSRSFRWPSVSRRLGRLVSEANAEKSTTAIRKPSDPNGEATKSAKETSWEVSPLVTGKGSCKEGIKASLRVHLLRRGSKKKQKEEEALEGTNTSSGEDDDPSSTSLPALMGIKQKLRDSERDIPEFPFSTTSSSSDAQHPFSSRWSFGSSASHSPRGVSPLQSRLERQDSATFRRFAASIKNSLGPVYKKRAENDAARCRTPLDDSAAQQQPRNQSDEEEQLPNMKESQNDPVKTTPVTDNSAAVSLSHAFLIRDGESPLRGRGSYRRRHTYSFALDSPASENQLRLSSAVATSALAKRRLNLARGLPLSPLYNTLDGGPENEPSYPAWSGNDPVPAVNIRDVDDARSGCHEEKRTIEDVPVKGEENDKLGQNTTNSEYLQMAVADVLSAKKSVSFSLHGIQDACAHQHRNIDDLVSRWLLEKSLPQSTRSEVISLIRTQTHSFLLTEEADNRCKRLEKHFQRVEKLSKRFSKANIENRIFTSQDTMELEGSGSPVREEPEENPQNHALAPVITAGAIPAKVRKRRNAVEEKEVADVDYGFAEADLSEAIKRKASSSDIGPMRNADNSASNASEEESSIFFSEEDLTSNTSSQVSSMLFGSSDASSWDDNRSDAGTKSLFSQSFEEDEELEAMDEIEGIVHRLRLSTLETVSHCTASKEEVSYAYKRLLYWVTIMEEPDLRRALIEEAQATASEEQLIKVQKNSQQLLSSYIRQVSPSEYVPNIPRVAQEAIGMVNSTSRALWKSFEKLRQRQFHLDIWLGLLVKDQTSGKHLMRQIQGLTELQEQAREVVQYNITQLQTQQLVWPYIIEVVDKQLRHHSHPFDENLCSVELWKTAQEITRTNAEVYYLLAADKDFNRRLRFWKKTVYNQAVTEKKKKIRHETVEGKVIKSKKEKDKSRDSRGQN